MKTNIARSLRTVKSVITANSPVLLVGATITGVVATGVLAAKAGYKARGIVQEELDLRAKNFDDTPLETKEIAKLTWLCYASPVLTGASTIASCLGLHMIHTKRHAALAGLYAITSGKLEDYKDEAEKLLGTKKTQQLNDVVAQKSADDHGFVNNELTLVEGGSELCYDDWSGRWFMSNMAQISQAMNEVNAMLLDEGELDLNTVYDRLGLTPLPMGTEFGWTKNDKLKRIDLTYGNITSKDGRPAIAITFRHEPKPELGR